MGRPVSQSLYLGMSYDTAGLDLRSGLPHLALEPRLGLDPIQSVLQVGVERNGLANHKAAVPGS
jgi:hypothetical protein